MSGNETPDEYERKYMLPGELVLHRDKVVQKTAFKVSLGLAIAFALFGLVGFATEIGRSSGAAVAVTLPMILLGALMGGFGVLFSVSRVMLTDSHLHVHFGWVKQKIPLGTITSVKAVRLQGFRNGKMTVGLDGVVRTWVCHSVSGDGVEVRYQQPGGRQHILTMGSEEAARFAAAIERARSSVGEARGSGAAKATVDKVRISESSPTDEGATAELDDAAEASGRTDRAGRL